MHISITLLHLHNYTVAEEMIIVRAIIIIVKPVPSEGDQPWDFFGRNDDKAETPVLWPPHAKS